MSLSIAELQPVLRDLFNEDADYLARQSHFCRRARKLTGPVFAQSLVFTLLQNPDATLDDYADTAEEVLDTPVSAQAFDQRFSPAAATFLQDLFLHAFNQSFTSLRPTLLPVLNRFNGVFLRDATLISLPACLASLFPGRGGLHAPHGKAAGVKMVLEAEVTTGEFTDVSILAGLDNERIAEVAGKPLPKGALLLEDMGFFSGERLQAHFDQGVYVLTRVPWRTAFFDLQGHRLNLLKELRHFKGNCLDRQVRILHECKLEVRLLAMRVPEQVAQQRRQRVIREAKQRGRPVSQRQLDLCEWNILVTNAPQEVLRRQEAFVVRRVRWQVELVFKVFKSEGKIDETSSDKPYRVICELYAKLLGMVVQQWTLLAAGCQMLKHSARRASRRVRKGAMKLLKAIQQRKKLGRVVAQLAKHLYRRCRIVHRRATPSTLDRLIACEPEYEHCRMAA